MKTGLNNDIKERGKELVFWKTIKVYYLLAGSVTFLFFFSLFSNPQPAGAQSSNWMANNVLAFLRNAPWKIGHLTGYRSFTLGHVGYDSDIYYGFLDKEYPDFTFTAGPSFQWFVPLKKLIIFDTFQQVQGDFYAENAKERTLNFRTRSQFHFLHKKFYGKTALSYDNMRRRFSPELILNIRQESLTWEGLMLWQFSRT